MGYTIDKKRLSKWILNVQQEIANIQFGEPKFRTGPPLHFEDNKAVPVLSVLERLTQAPSKENFDAFIRQVTQDLGKPTGDGFLTWSVGIFNKTFKAAIKDGFYDCFKVAHISMDQKQVDLMEKASTRMAIALGEQISKTVSAQLEVLVERLKKAEVKPTSKPRAVKKAEGAQADDSK
jgi:hypothetical protein